ncbi:MAG TPA: Hpt domain-containing protein [Thauera aminoaromatica]|nr:Hpt domain-containing protein [Thauera aminoaromatica]
MTHATEPDLGPLTWVKGEIDAALGRAREILERGCAGSEAAGLQFAQSHLHQVRGALDIVGLDGLTLFTDALEQLLGAMARGEVPADAARHALALRALAMVGNYLEELADGAPDQPLRLAARYLELAAARGQHDASAADLFHPDLSRRPPARAAPPADTTGSEARELRAARSRFERGLLEWLRKGAAGEGARVMRDAIAEVEAQQRSPAARSLWWASLAFYDALIHGGLQPDPAVKRLCTQLDAQFRRLLSGTPSVPDRLLRELLYQIARAPVRTEQQRAVRACWQLDAQIPEPGLEVGETPIAPLLDALAARLGEARAHWEAFCAGTAVALPRFEDAVAAMSAPAEALGRPGVRILCAALLDFARWLRRDPLQFVETSGMEVATALLSLEGALDRRPPPAGFGARAEQIAARLLALQRGEPLSAGAIVAAPADARQAQERAALEQVAKEMLASLAHVEQVLDDFFRNQARREPLLQLHQPLQQIIGALSMLGETDALALVRNAAIHIASLAREDSRAGQAEFERLARDLSALGFYIEAMPRGGARLEELLDPSLGLQGRPAAQEDAAAPAAAIAATPVAAPAPTPATEAAAAAPVEMPEQPPPAAAEPPPQDLDAAATQVAAAHPESPENLFGLDFPDLDFSPLEELETPAAMPQAATEPVGTDARAPAAAPELAATVAAESAAAPMAAGAAPVGAEIDAELLAIFIEEAHEVLAGIAAGLEALRDGTDEPAQLVTIRRGFHTLKGSGRMVGLVQLGDTAWAVEQALNRWLQLDWALTPALFALVAEGHRVFSAWVAQLEHGEAGGGDTAALIAEARRLHEAAEPVHDAGITTPSGALPPLPEPIEEIEAEPAATAPASAPMQIDSVDFLLDGEIGGAPPAPPAGTEETTPVFPAATAASEAEEELIEFIEPLDEGAPIALEAFEFFPAQPDEVRIEGGDDEVAPAQAPAATQDDAPASDVAASPAGDTLRIGDGEISRALHALYCSESAQHLAALEQALRALHAGDEPPSTAAIRAAHTLAGISGTVRAEAAHRLGRALEHRLERLADATRAPDGNELALFGEALDALRAMRDEIAAGGTPAAEDALVARLDARADEDSAGLADLPEALAPDIALAVDAQTALDGARAADHATPPPAAPASLPAALPAAEAGAVDSAQDDIDSQLLPIFLEEAAETIGELHATLRRWRMQADDEEAPRAVARLLHSLKGSARMAGAMRLGAHLHELESRLEDGLAAREAAAGLAEALAHGIDRCEQVIDELALGEAALQAPAAPIRAEEAGAGAEAAPEVEPLASPTLRVRAERIDRFVNQAGEIGVARSRVEGELRSLRRSLLDLTENVIRLRNQLREVEIQAEVQMQSRIAQAGTQHTDFDPLELDRYTRLQELTRMMAESVNDVTTVQQGLLHNLDGAELALGSQARMARELQQGLMQVRMLPFDNLASRLYRVVRQSARELGKRAALDLRGGRIEVDRSVLEQMAAPLEHLLRNAVAHGIEAPAARLAAGKAETGNIELTVRQEGNEIAIEIADDGAGLDLERIAAQARARGLLGADERVDERRLVNLIFVSGFSTAREVSAVSGRGVGMDVVKAQTAAAGGRVEVASRPGAGTRFSIRLPLTLAVTQTLLVEALGRSWAVPANMIVQAMELKPDALQAMQRAHGIEWQGEHYPYRYLPRLLGDREARPAEARYSWVLLLRAGAQTLALHVDGLRGNQEVIVKNAGPQLTRVVGMSGATVLGDGEIVLILNPVALGARAATTTDEAHAGLFGPAAEAPPPLHLPTVMVVDDSLTVRKITGRLLEREGYRVLTAKDGVDALEQLIDLKPDVVLTDIEMPRMDGFDLVRNIRADARLHDLPVVVITSRLAEKHRRYALEVGADHYLGKPYQEEELLALVARYAQAGKG